MGMKSGTKDLSHGEFMTFVLKGGCKRGDKEVYVEEVEGRCGGCGGEVWRRCGRLGPMLCELWQRWREVEGWDYA